MRYFLGASRARAKEPFGPTRRAWALWGDNELALMRCRHLPQAAAVMSLSAEIDGSIKGEPFRGSNHLFCDSTGSYR